MTRETAYETLTGEGRRQIKVGVELFARHIDRLATEAAEVGKEKEAETFKAEADALRSVLVPKVDEAGVLRLNPVERRAVHKGLGYYVKNLRAAKGTLKGLGKDAIAETFEEEAVEVEGEFVKQFAEQVELEV